MAFSACKGLLVDGFVVAVLNVKKAIAPIQAMLFLMIELPDLFMEKSLTVNR